MERHKTGDRPDGRRFCVRRMLSPRQQLRALLVRKYNTANEVDYVVDPLVGLYEKEAALRV